MSKFLDEEPGAITERSARIVYSLLKGAIQVARRFRLPLDRLAELTRLAYFEELRHESPRDLERVAANMGLSLRSVSKLNKRIKEPFFTPETRVEPVDVITKSLVHGPRSRAQLMAEHPGLSPTELDLALEVIVGCGWARCDDDDRYALGERWLSFVDDDDFDAKIFGLNRQMALVANAVWARFVASESSEAVARTWDFAAIPAELEEFVEGTVKRLRYGAIDLEESALKQGERSRFGFTIAVAPLNDEESKP